MKKLFDSGRPNKLANGFYITEKRANKRGFIRVSNPLHPNYNKKGTYHDILSLNVRGTTDTLGRGWFLLVKKIKKEHPTDKGYFKEVYILTESGKQKLKNKKFQK